MRDQMKVYAEVRKGTRATKKQCDDRILIGTEVLECGSYEKEIEVSGLVLAVADGVGSCRTGWFAAKTVLEDLGSMVGQNLSGHTTLLRQINDRLAAIRDTDEEMQDSLCTLSYLYFQSDSVTGMHLGDSRIYHMRDLQGYPCFEQLTEDQNRLHEICDREDNVLSPKEIKKAYPDWASITGYMGMSTELLEKRAQMIQSEASEGVFLLSTDGVHDFVEKKTMREILQEECSGGEKIRKLMDLARDNGSRDDQSVILAEW